MQSNPSARGFQVGIVIFDDVEVLDFAGPFEVFTVAGEILKDSADENRQVGTIRALTIAQSDQIVKARGNLLIQPHSTFENHPLLDLLVVPGGWGTRRQAENPVMSDWLRRVTPTTTINASVCTGAFLLGMIGLFDGRKATTHWKSLDRMTATFPNVQVMRDVRWVDEGNVVSSAGISAGIDMSLHLVERLYGMALADETAHEMEYHWQKHLA